MKCEKGKSSSPKNQRGSALLLVLMVTTILLIMGTAALNISTKTRKTADLEQEKTQALYYAESGINANIEAIKERIAEYLTAKAAGKDVDPFLYENAGSSYQLSVTLENEEENVFLAVSHGFLNGKDNLQIRKTISMKFQPSDEEGVIIPSEPPGGTGGGSGEPGGMQEIAKIFKYGIYTGSTLNMDGKVIVDGSDVYTLNNIQLTTASRINGNLYSKGQVALYGSSVITKNAYVDNLCIVNNSSIEGDAYVKELDMDGSGTIKGNAYVATKADINNSTLEKDAYARNFWFWRGSKINGTAYYSQSLNVNSTTVNKRQQIPESEILTHINNQRFFIDPSPELPPVNYDAEKAAITQAAQGRTVNSSFSQWQSTVNQSNCTINGSITAGAANITLDNCIIKNEINIYNSRLKISNCIIEGSFNMGGNYGNNIVLEIDGLVWVKGSVNLNNDVTIKGNGIIVSEGSVTWSGDVNAYNNGNTNLAMISQSGSIQMSNSTKIKGLLYAPNGSITLSNSVHIYGSIVGKQVKVQGDSSGTGTIINYHNLNDFPLPLPGSSSGGGGGSSPQIPNIAGIKVIEWIEE